MIKNIIFDMGDVLIGYRWQDMLIKDFGVEEKRALAIGPKVFDDPMWAALDAGKIQVDAAIDGYMTKYPEDGSIIRRMFVEAERMPVMRPRVWEKVQKLKDAGYKLYLLSNYSKYLFEKHTSDVPVLKLFDGMVISYEHGTIKPEKEIYEKVLNENNLVPQECIFFDDKKENVEAAKKMGINSREVTSEERLLEYLDEMLTN